MVERIAGVSTGEEKTRWSPGLTAFYVGCGAVSLGAAVGFSGWFVFRKYDVFPVVVTAGVLLVVSGCVAMLLGLKAARRA